MTLRVAIADDHLLVREGVRALLETDTDVRVVAAVATGTELIDAVAQLHPDAVLTDIRMPGPTGIDTALTIRRNDDRVGVVLLSQHLDHEYARQLFAHGSAGLGYLLKERIGHRAHLVDALTATARGGSVVDPRVVGLLLTAQQASSPVSRMTPRERDVLALMATGLSNPSIGERLHLSLSSVEKHVTAIFTALDLAEPEPATHRRVLAVLRYLQASG